MPHPPTPAADPLPPRPCRPGIAAARKQCGTRRLSLRSTWRGWLRLAVAVIVLVALRCSSLCRLLRMLGLYRPIEPVAEASLAIATYLSNRPALTWMPPVEGTEAAAAHEVRPVSSSWIEIGF